MTEDIKNELTQLITGFVAQRKVDMLRLYEVEKLSMAQIARLYGMSRQRVSKILDLKHKESEGENGQDISAGE